MGCMVCVCTGVNTIVWWEHAWHTLYYTACGEVVMNE